MTHIDARSPSAALLLLICLAGAAVGETYSDLVHAQSPFEYYRLGDLQGENGDTFSANLVTVGQSTPAPGLTSTSTPAFAGVESDNTWANFDGSASAVLTDIVTGWNSDAGTISYWVRMDGDGMSTETGLFGRQTGGAGVFGGSFPQAIATFQRLNGSFGISIDGNQVESGTAVLATNEWHHLAFTWNRHTGQTNGVIRCYLDGVEETGATNLTWDSFVINDAVRFGKEISGGTRVFKGSADELAIWTRELSYQEVAQQYWRGVTRYANVVVVEGFQGCHSTLGGQGLALDGQQGWAGTGFGVRRGLQTWSRMGGEWVYLGSGSRQAKKVGTAFAGNRGKLTCRFSGRAAGKKSLFGFGYDDGSGYQPFLYCGTDGANVRLMPIDGSGGRHNAFVAMATTQTQLMRMQVVVDLDADTGSFSYYDGTAWQAPAELQDLDVYLNSGPDANDPTKWNTVVINGTSGGCWDNIVIVYDTDEPPVSPIEGTVVIVR